MDLHGCQLEIPVALSIPTIMSEVEKFWPQAVYTELVSETMIYKNMAARDAWDAGWSEENDVTMIHVIFNEGSTYFVIDDHEELKPIVEEIATSVGL